MLNTSKLSKEPSNLVFPRIMLLLWLTLLPFARASASQFSLCDQVFQALQSKNSTLLNRSLEQIEEKAYEPCLLQLYPKYFWAQNMTHLMVKFQFLNSADTSACSRVLSVVKKVEHGQFFVSLTCVQSHFLLRYRIKVQTFMAMNFYHAQWKTAQQNTIILLAPKSPSPYFWTNLYRPNHQPLRKPKIWWKMMEKYRQNLQKFIYDLQVQEEEQEISAYVKRRRQRRRHKLAEIYNAQSQKYLYCNQNNPFELGSWLP